MVCMTYYRASQVLELRRSSEGIYRFLLYSVSFLNLDKVQTKYIRLLWLMWNLCWASYFAFLVAIHNMIYPLVIIRIDLKVFP